MIKYILLIIFTSFAYSQSVGDFGNESLLKKGIENKINKQSLTKTDEVPSTGFVDSKFYYLGAGDIVFLKSTPSFPEGELITISPEGTLILPRNFGIVDVKNKSLSKVEEEIKELVKQKTFSLSLYKSKTCSIEITGDVLTSGILTLPGTYRISDVFNIANYSQENSTNQVSQLKNLNKYKREARTAHKDYLFESKSYIKERNIKVLRSDGSIFNADIVKSLSKENKELNPYIMPGDKIFVSGDIDGYNTIQISGAVVNQALIMHKEGDKLSDIIKIAGGLSYNADLNDVKLYTPDNSYTDVTLNENLEVIGNDPVLAPNSILVIGQKNEEKQSATGVVMVKGEVNKPGAVVIKNGVTKISEIIELAGGLKETAYLPLARVSTKNGGENEDSDFWDLYRDQAFFQYSDLGVDDTLRMGIDIKFKTSNLAVDVENALAKGKDDIALNNGDKIYIPKNPMRVYVFGKVNQPGYIRFEKGKNVEWYIKQVGGNLPSADMSRVSIIRGRSLVWIEPDENTEIYAGDMIYIPSYPEISEQAEIQKWATYTSIGVSIINVLIFVVANIISLSR